jgi:hypothetical protein
VCFCHMQVIPYNHLMLTMFSYAKLHVNITQTYPLGNFHPSKIVDHPLIPHRESQSETTLPSISTDVSGHRTIQVCTHRQRICVPAGMCCIVVYNCCYHLRRIPGGGDDIIIRHGSCLGTFLQDRRMTVFSAQAFPNSMTYVMAMNSGRFALVILTFVTFITIIAVPSFAF